MKKLSLLCILIVLALCNESCKKEETAGALPPLDITKSDAAKVATLLREATELFNAKNAITAGVKADQAQTVFNGAMSPGRKIIISEECPLSYLQGNGSMMLLGLSCNAFLNKRPANVAGTFNEHMMIFVVTSGAGSASQGNRITDTKIADTIKKAPQGTKFTGTLLISDPGILIEAEEGFLYSYSMSYNVKILDIEKSR